MDDTPPDDGPNAEIDSTAADATDSTRADEPGPLREAIRTVTPPYLGRPDTEMNAVGWGYLAVLVVLLVPFLPFAVLIWGTVRLIELVDGEE